MLTKGKRKFEHIKKLSKIVDNLLIPELRHFRPASLILDITQYIEDGYQEGKGFFKFINYMLIK